MVGLVRFALYGILAGVFFSWIVEFLKFADLWKVVHNQVPGPCHEVGNVYNKDLNIQGSEDVEVLPNGVAIFSSGLNYMRNPVLSHIKGRIMSFDFNQPDLAAKELKIIGFKSKLNPHGLSWWQRNGQTFIYLINHRMDVQDSDESVEKFLLDESAGTLTHMRTIKDEFFTSLNDLVMVDEDKFFVTNDYTFRNNWLRRLEYFLFLPTNNVVYFDGRKGEVSVRGLRRANGIALSPDNRFLYIGESGAKRLTTYRLYSPTHLEFISSTYLGTVVDNIFVDRASGDVWLGTHPVGYQIFMKVAYPLAAVAPSQVLRLCMKGGTVKESSQVYADTGESLLASGTAAFFNGSFLIGTPTQKLLYCVCSIC